MTKYLVTGAAGFIGFHLTKRLLDEGREVVGIDNLNNYYDVSLKEARLHQLTPNKRFTFFKMDIADDASMKKIFAEHEFDRVLHLAAQAGVRYSLENPHAYIQSNIVGFMNVLECCRSQWTTNSILLGGKKRHLVYASSSSVYGLNRKMPFSVRDNVDHPISLYAATKKSNELMAHTYSHLYGLPTTGLRFFTVYGPWGRPDMALFKFTKAILGGETIDVYNEGNMKRDFTYIDDIVEGVVRVAEHIPECCSGQQETEPSISPAPYRLYNIGNNSPVNLMDFIHLIEAALGRKAKINYLPMQPGDVAETYADVDDLKRDIQYSPSTKIQVGVHKFIKWYREYFERSFLN